MIKQPHQARTTEMKPQEYPLTPKECHRLTFQRRQSLSAAGRIIVLVALAAAAIALVVPDLSTSLQLGILSACALFTVVGMLAALWTDNLLLDFDDSLATH